MRQRMKMWHQAAHRSELVGEAGLRTAYHRHKTAPYRNGSEITAKYSKSKTQRLAYPAGFLANHPELKKPCDCPDNGQKQKPERQ